MAILNNKWMHGTTFFTLPPLSPELQTFEGIGPWNLVVDPKVGTETVLLLLDRTPFIHGLAKVRPFVFELKSGLVRTSHGPLLFMLFYIPDPKEPGTVFCALDAHVNPCDPKHMVNWHSLARQTHWHLILVGDADKLVDLFEFPNTFGLSQTLDQVESVCQKMQGGSFDDAKAEFCDKYTLDDLFRM